MRRFRMSRTMKRWQMDAIGREKLRLETVPRPEPARGEVLVEVLAVSLNYRDKLIIETGMGLPLQFPFTPASDLGGRVVAAGPETKRFKPGDRVISVFSPFWIDGRSPGTARHPPYRTLGGVFPGVLTEFIALPEDWVVA